MFLFKSTLSGIVIRLIVTSGETRFFTDVGDFGRTDFCTVFKLGFKASILDSSSAFCFLYSSIIGSFTLKVLSLCLFTIFDSIRSLYFCSPKSFSALAFISLLLSNSVISVESNSDKYFLAVSTSFSLLRVFLISFFLSSIFLFNSFIFCEDSKYSGVFL